MTCCPEILLQTNRMRYKCAQAIEKEVANMKEYKNHLNKTTNTTLLLLALCIFLWTSCKSEPTSKTPTPKEKQDASSSKSNDLSTSVQKNELEHPNWLRNHSQALVDKLEQPGQSKVFSYKQLNDSLSYAIFEISSDLCVNRHLKTFLGEKKIDDLEIQSICDHDQSAAVNKWKEYELNNASSIESNSIKLMKCYKYAAASKNDNKGASKSTLDFLEVTAKIDTLVTYHQIKPNGSIATTIKN